MAVTVEQLYKTALPHYMMQLVAGGNGIGNPVKWVHVAENKDVVHFIHGNEMIFTTGIRGSSANWLYDFTESLHKRGTSALVVNVGPYIHEIPRQVTEFCNDTGMPVFTIPWTTQIASMTRDFGKTILQNEKREASIAGAVKNILFHIGDHEENILKIERCGFLRTGKYCFACVTLAESSLMPGDDEETDNDLLSYLGFSAAIAARGMRDRILQFRYDDKMVLLFADHSAADIKRFLQDYRSILKNRGYSGKVNIGVSENVTGLDMQENNFKSAISANKIAQKHDMSVVYYEKQDLYKLLYAIGDTVKLQDFFNRILGNLAQYDAVNGTTLMLFLRQYIESNNNHQLMAERLYMHRNTVSNQLRKVEKIIGFPITDIENEMKCLLAFYIQDIL